MMTPFIGSPMPHSGKRLSQYVPALCCSHN
jgi:hypothetical protein